LVVALVNGVLAKPTALWAVSRTTYIEALEEGTTVDEIESLTGGRTEIAYDEVNVAGSPTDISVE